jgi:hypothetical protein
LEALYKDVGDSHHKIEGHDDGVYGGAMMMGITMIQKVILFTI